VGEEELEDSKSISIHKKGLGFREERGAIGKRHPPPNLKP
jgi:hypothetical protein